MVAGYPLKIDARLWEEDRALTQNALQVLQYEIGAVAKELPADAMKKIANVPIWLEAETLNNSPIQYHYSRSWLLENGYNPKKESSIEIVAKDFIQIAKVEPFPLLGSFAAAYGQRVGITTNNIVLAAFGSVVTKKLYRVTRVEDYFASLSQRYFSDVQSSEYKREKFRNQDSLGFEMIRAIWNVK